MSLVINALEVGEAHTLAPPILIFNPLSSSFFESQLFPLLMFLLLLIHLRSLSLL